MLCLRLFFAVAAGTAGGVVVSQTAQCPGIIVTTPVGVPLCQDGAGAPVLWVAYAEFDVSQLDGPSLAACFGIGFTIIGMSWFIGRCVGMVLKAVRHL
jgi:hypothetical protein